MRRLVAISILVVLGFWIAYGLVAPFRSGVNHFAVKIAGPTVANAVGGVATGIVSKAGLAGFAAITMAVGVVGGIAAHFYWVKADWRLRRWGASRTSRDLGTTDVTHYPSTPAGATTRPAQKEKVVPIEEEKPLEETKTE